MSVLYTPGQYLEFAWLQEAPISNICFTMLLIQQLCHLLASDIAEPPSHTIACDSYVGQT